LGKKVRIEETYEDPSDFLVKVEKRKGKPVLTINLATGVELRRLFDRGYLDAVLAHEAAHLKPQRWLRERIYMPKKLLETFGLSFYNRESQYLDMKYNDLISDACAIALTPEKYAREFLAFLTESLRDSLLNIGAMPAHQFLKIYILLPTALLETASRALGLPVPGEVASVTRVAVKDPVDTEIYNYLKKVFSKAFSQTRAGEEVDVLQLSYVLKELIESQPEPYYQISSTFHV